LDSNSYENTKSEKGGEGGGNTEKASSSHDLKILNSKLTKEQKIKRRINNSF